MLTATIPALWTAPLSVTFSTACPASTLATIRLRLVPRSGYRGSAFSGTRYWGSSSPSSVYVSSAGITSNIARIANITAARSGFLLKREPCSVG